jgi:hypothetical protein
LFIFIIGIMVFEGWKIIRGVSFFDLPLPLQRRGVDQTFPVR